MIMATEAKIITKIVREQQKEEKIKSLIDWCESLESDILKSAREGTWCIWVIPRIYGYLLPNEERDKIIEDFFKHYGYTAEYSNYNSKIRISWN